MSLYAQEWKLRQEDQELKTSHSYTEKPYLKQTNKQINKVVRVCELITMEVEKRRSVV